MNKEKSIYIFNGRKVTQDDIEQALIDSGLQEGDIVLVHSDVSSFGKLGDIKDRKEFLSSLLNAFLNVLGDGTLVVPTYTYSFCKKEIFDVKNSKSTVGIFSEFVRNQPSAVRSEDPIFSHAAIGKDAEKLLKKVSNVCFGEDSFFDRFYNVNGKIINFGKFFDITFLHYIERKFNVDYRFDKKFYGKIIKEDGKEEIREVVFYARYLPKDGKNVEYDLSKLGNELQKRGLLKKVDVGNSFILCSKARDCFKVGIEMLKNNNYAFLKSDPNELVFESLPFYTGVLDSPKNNGLPDSLPFTLKFDKTKRLIVQKYSAETEKVLENAYKKGSLVSTNAGQGSFGIRRADEVLNHISLALKGNVREKSFLEVGCSDGYLLCRLKEDDAKRVLGCEPGPMALEGSKKHGVEIINDFYKEGIVEEKFDCVFSYGVLEHIFDPDKFIETQKGALNKKGVVFVAVPNCEIKLAIGDYNILGHEHWNYFTRNSLRRLLERCGLNDVETRIGMNNAIIYAWGVKDSRKQEEVENDNSEEDLFHNFYGKLMKNIALLKQRAKALIDQGKTLGFYGGGLNIIGILPPNIQPRFFDGDVAKHGKYFPGCKNAIESPKNLLNNKVDEVWIEAIDYNEEILDYLKNKIKVSHEIKLVSIKEIMESNNVGDDMYNLVKRLFPICRSITGNGVRETLKIIQEHIPIKIHEVPTGTRVFDWTVPKEWNIKDAYVMDESGNKIIDFKKNNLHVLGYSVPVNKTVSLSELQEHLYSLPEQPEAIPYVTSYYKERWGFCIAYKDKEKLKEGKYKVLIDSELKDGSLTYGELIIPGKSEKEVFLSTYVCHPSMANNELSGPVVITYIVKWIMSKPRKYTYRIIFIPETIGSITYLSKNLDIMKKNIVAGFNVFCVGDNKVYSYLPSRNGDTYADRIALNILSFKHPNFIKYSFLDKGSDERQYNAPGVELPLCCIMRSKDGTYQEYHTSLDNLEFVSPEGLSGAYDVFKECLNLIEKNEKYKIKCLGEPQLGKRGLYPTINTKSSEIKDMMNFISYADGKNDLIDISNKINIPIWEVYQIIEKLLRVDLLEVVS